MPRYVIERQYLVPVYEHILVEAPDFETACRRALDEIDQPWGSGIETDYEGARPTTIERAVELSAEVDLEVNALADLLYTAGLEPLDITVESTEAKPTYSAIGFV